MFCRCWFCVGSLSLLVWLLLFSWGCLQSVSSERAQKIQILLNKNSHTLVTGSWCGSRIELNLAAIRRLSKKCWFAKSMTSLISCCVLCTIKYKWEKKTWFLPEVIKSLCKNICFYTGGSKHMFFTTSPVFFLPFFFQEDCGVSPWN